MARLKVFTTAIGFYETVVAAPSQKAALEAWGVRHDLFAAGAARVSQDKAAIDSALAQPGVVLRRAAGSSGVFERDGDLSGLAMPAPPRARARAKVKAATAPSPPPKPPPDRSALTAAEAALARRQAKYNRDRDRLEVRRKALDAEAAALGEAYAVERRSLEGLRQDAEKAYRQASKLTGA